MKKIRIILVLAIAAMFAGCTRVVPGTALFTPVEYVTTNEPSVPEGYFRNPILPGFYPDPSICRVGDDYWMVNSSFAYFPGLPVWHSTDLIHWESCGPALSRSHDFFLAPPSNIVTGSYAPQITFNPANGLYYIINTYVAGYWNFFITSPDPASGQWSEPTILPEVPGIDPSILFDQDGRAYIVSAPGRDAIGETKLYAEDNAIVLFDFDYEKGVTGERTVIARSGVHPEEQPNALEGPHLYHIGDKYFLMCAEGGTMLGHSEVIFEAPAVKGPYTPCPINPILTQRDVPDADIRCTGHADLVQSASGEWYAVFLGTESYDGEYNFNTGRQTFLHPVTWTEGQPVILPAGEKLPSQVPLNDDLKALCASNRIKGIDTRQPGPLWNGRDGLSDQTLFIRNPVSGSLKGLTWEGGAAGSEDFDFNKGRFEGPFWHIRRSGKMELRPKTVSLREEDNPAAICQRVTSKTFTMTTTMTFDPQGEDDAAGLLLFQNHDNMMTFSKTRDADGKVVMKLEEISGGKTAKSFKETQGEKEAGKPVTLKVEAETAVDYVFSVSFDGGKSWRKIGEPLDGHTLKSSYYWGFTGAVAGVFAYTKE